MEIVGFRKIAVCRIPQSLPEAKSKACPELVERAPDSRFQGTTNLEGPPALPFADNSAPGAENVYMPSLVQVDFELKIQPKTALPPPPPPVEISF